MYIKNVHCIYTSSTLTFQVPKIRYHRWTIVTKTSLTFIYIGKITILCLGIIGNQQWYGIFLWTPLTTHYRNVMWMNAKLSFKYWGVGKSFWALKQVCALSQLSMTYYDQTSTHCSCYFRQTLHAAYIAKQNQCTYRVQINAHTQVTYVSLHSKRCSKYSKMWRGLSQICTKCTGCCYCNNSFSPPLFQGEN